MCHQDTSESECDDWINTITIDDDGDESDEEESDITEDTEDDEFGYLYHTSSRSSLNKPIYHNPKKSLTTSSNSNPSTRIVENGLVQNSARKSSPPPNNTTSDSPKLVSSSSKDDYLNRLSRSSSKRYATKCGYPFIKRGKFKGFYDYRKYRCVYTNYSPTFKCNHSNCYCAYFPVVPSPLRNQPDFYDELSSYNGSDDTIELNSGAPDFEENKSSNMNSDENNFKSGSNGGRDSDNHGSSFSSQFKNRYGLSRVKQRFIYSNSGYDKTTAGVNHNDIVGITSTNSDTPVPEKLSKRMKRYHSVNNLAKRALLKHHLIAKSDEQQHKAPTIIHRPTSSRSTNPSRAHHHNYHHLKPFNSLDLVF